MITLARITPELADSYKTVRLRALQDTPTAFGSTYAKESQLSAQDWRERAARLDGRQAAGYLAWDGDDACGIVACFLDREDAARAHLVSMWVAPTHRCRGVGQMLVHAVIDWARSRGVVATLSLMVTSNNDAAMRFYERLAFIRTGRTEPYPNDSGLVELEMSRSI
jgi:ribosomal protein S18 acetylase RimI-like enzyme